MNVFRFLQEMSGQMPYEFRAIKGSLARNTTALALLEEEIKDWWSTLEQEDTE